MGKRIIVYSIFYCCFFLITGCRANETLIEPVVELEQKPTVISQVQYASNTNATDLQMKEFFEDYLSIDEEAILVLNQKPQKVEDEYWAAYRSYHSQTNQMLGKYLSNDINKKLKNQYTHDNFHYFKLLEISDHMIIGISDVKDAIIISKSLQEDNDLYEVMVTARAKVIDLELANRIYKWDNDLGYYIKNEEAYMENELAIKNSLDEIKINLFYQVELPKGEKFTVNSVREKSNISLGLGRQNSPKNNNFVSCIPYQEEVKIKDQEKIYQYMDSFLKRDKDFYHYYKQAYHTSAEAFQTVFYNDLGLKNIVYINKDTYKDDFNLASIPIKDAMNCLSFDLENDIIIEPHVSSSKNHPTYEVKVKADVTLVKGKVLPYEYSYLFLFENDMISTVRFITQNEDTTQEDT